jgi:hypothetical protein
MEITTTKKVIVDKITLGFDQKDLEPLLLIFGWASEKEVDREKATERVASVMATKMFDKIKQILANGEENERVEIS